MAMIEREQWRREERQRVPAALARARFWQSVAPHKIGFWEAVDETLLAHYPAVGTNAGRHLTTSERRIHERHS